MTENVTYCEMLGDTKLKTKKGQSGRSMVEMLGVLAIIGVLSVGAIAGYQKAMFKYKLNKQAQQLTQIISVMSEYCGQWGTILDSEVLNYLRKSGQLPNEMFKEHEGNFLFDTFDNKISLAPNDCRDGICHENIMRYYMNDRSEFDICYNFVQTAVSFASEISKLGNYFQKSDGDVDYSGTYYGESFCSDSRKCLRNITMDDIQNMCQRCKDQELCAFFVIWTKK